MDRCWGITAEQDENVETDVTTDQRTVTPGVLGKRHATSPAGLDEVLGLCRTRNNEEEENMVSSVQAAKPRCPRKHRKSTHVVRKEEKERLLKEMEMLNGRIENLKQIAMVSLGDVDAETARRIQVRRELRDNVQENQQKFGEVAAIMSEFSICNAQAGSPLHDKIYLKWDRDSRRKTLRMLKATKMPKAVDFLQLRRPNTSLRKVCDEGRRFEMDNGDFFSERLTVTQFKDAHSVRQIFDLLLFYYCNLEISISEKIGHITVRLDDDNGNKSITQNRLVSTTIKDIKVESNIITFAQFYEHDDKSNHGEGDYGMIVMDYADNDEKYPYQPDDCVRKDVVAVMEVRECPQYSKHNDKMTVVLTRWVQSKLHRPEFPVEVKDWTELRDKMDLFGKTMQRSLAEDLHVEALGLRMAGNSC